VTASDDEKDFMAAQDYYNLCAADRQPAGPAPNGYFEPTGQFSKEEEVKIYHSMFDHIIGVDGLCVYPHCKKPKEDFDPDRALFLSDRYVNSFKENWEELEKYRIALQDAEQTRVMFEKITQNSRPPVPPDPTGSLVPRGKPNRHQKKHKPRAMTLPSGSGITSAVSDLRRCIYIHNFTTQLNPSTDRIRYAVVRPESDCKIVTRPALNPDDSLDPEDCANYDIDLKTFPPSSLFHYDSDEYESDDGYTYM